MTDEVGVLVDSSAMAVECETAESPDQCIWAVIVTTVAGREESCGKTLASLADAGFTRVLVMCEQGVGKGTIKQPPSMRVDFAVHNGVAGPWKSFLNGLTIARQYRSKATLYLVVQDDTVVSKGLRKYLETDPRSRQVLKDGALGLLSLFCPGGNDTPLEDGSFRKAGWYKMHRVGKPPGGCCLVFHRRTVDVLVSERPFRDRFAGVDSNLGQWCEQNDLEGMFHLPSLADHCCPETTTIAGSEEKCSMANLVWRTARRFVQDCDDMTIVESPHWAHAAGMAAEAVAAMEEAVKEIDSQVLKEEESLIEGVTDDVALPPLDAVEGVPNHGSSAPDASGGFDTGGIDCS